MTSIEVKEVIKQSIDNGLINLSIENSFDCEIEDKAVGFFYNLDSYDANVRKLQEAFPSNFLHAAAVKANQLAWFLRHRKDLGLGAECASLEEVHLALSSGTKIEKIVFDSPTKTYQEILFVLKKGIHLNIDNFQELERVEKILEIFKKEKFISKSEIGIRINPLIGAGLIAELSVSTEKSKFGIPLPSGLNLNEKEKKYREKIINLISKTKFINCIHIHCGSGGMGLIKLCNGVKIAVDFVKEVNLRRKKLNISTLINCLDIGGGIGINFNSDQNETNFNSDQKKKSFNSDQKSKSFNSDQKGLSSINGNVYEEYKNLLKSKVPDLFNKKIFKKVITEFGASLNMNFGWLTSRVEYTKEYKNHNIVSLHAGSDVFLRQTYCNKQFAKNSVLILDLEDKLYKSTFDQKKSEINNKTYDFVGALCFAGDVVLKEVNMPPNMVKQDDFVVILDCGANSFALKNMHCSRRLPPIYGYRKKDNKFIFEVIKKQQSFKDIINYWK